MNRRTTLMVSGLVVAVAVLGGAGLAAMAAGGLGHGAGAGSSSYSTTLSGNAATGMMGTPSPGSMMGNGNAGAMWNSCYPSGMMGGATRGKTLTMAQAQQRVQSYIVRYGTTSLAIDEVMEFQSNFYAIVKDTSTGHGAFEVLVNKGTGAVYPEYGPAMMWNTQYGMMSGMMGYQQPTGPMTIASTQATTIAMQWLQQHQSGSTTETPEQFPGYYTLHILKNGSVTGMLSVNGFTGQVWFHTWHGAFMHMKDLHA